MCYADGTLSTEKHSCFHFGFKKDRWKPLNITLFKSACSNVIYMICSKISQN